MNDFIGFNSIFEWAYKNIQEVASNSFFSNNALLNGVISSDEFVQTSFRFYKKDSILDMYLCLLCADVAEDMIFPFPNGSYEAIERLAGAFENTFAAGRPATLCFDPNVAVYSGKYELAENLLGNVDVDILKNIMKSGNWDFIDKITDCGKNKKHIKIMTELLARDYLRGGDSFFDYHMHYSKNDFMTCLEAIDEALLAINSADDVFDAISGEADSILNTTSPDTDREKFNERALYLMERCAELGLRLKKFGSFNKILLPIYDDIEVDDGVFATGHRITELPPKTAELIDENTDVYAEYACCSDKTAEFEADNSFFLTPTAQSYFFDKKYGDNFGYLDELEYIGSVFHEKYGRRLAVIIDNPETLGSCRLSPQYADVFDFQLSDEFLRAAYENLNTLKRVLKTGMLSPKNIEEITEYYAKQVGETSGRKGYDHAVKRLRQLNDTLKRYGGSQNVIFSHHTVLHVEKR